jgi:2-succinyl-6-hydroxy-2,4-cyclohexadiene-1-carboxylate synthase
MSLASHNADPACSQSHLVLLHGLLGSAQEWQPLLHALPPGLRARCIALDLPGHGQAAERSVTLAHWPDWLESQLAARGVRDFILMGYSLGGRLALSYAASRLPSGADQAAPMASSSRDYPRLRGLILESCHPGLTNVVERQARARQDARWVRRFWREPLTVVLADWYQQPVFAELDEKHRARMIALRSQQSGRTLAPMLAATSLARQPDHSDWLARSEIPLLWITGALDQKFAALACQLARTCPRLAFRQLAHAGHNIHQARPERLAAELQGWLRQQPLLTDFF